MYVPIQTTVYGPSGTDLEAAARQQALIECDSRHLVLLDRTNKTFERDGDLYMRSTFTFMEVPPRYKLAS